MLTKAKVSKSKNKIDMSRNATRPRTPSNLTAKSSNNVSNNNNCELAASLLKPLTPIHRISSTPALWDFFPFVYRININGFTTQTLLQEVCKERGWKEFGPDKHNLVTGRLLGWNLWWKSSSSNYGDSSIINRGLFAWQFTNHIPQTFSLCNKSQLNLFVRYMKAKHGVIFDFGPLTFNLPDEYEFLRTEHIRRSYLATHRTQNIPLPNSLIKELRQRTESGETSSIDFQQFPGLEFSKTKPIWISKPIGKSQGKGIYLFNDMSNLSYEALGVVQEYIARPLLVGGYKCDLRLYVCIPYLVPLTVYVYNEGLVRFATEKYNLENLNSTFAHLTNASLNKLSPNYDANKDIIGPGCKWSLKQLRQYLIEEEQVCDWFLWCRVISIIVLTITAEASKGFHGCGGLLFNNNYFEFLGYDILLDEQLRPWLLEVNTSPGLSGDSKVDEIIKKPMLHELFNLLGLPGSQQEKEKNDPDEDEDQVSVSQEENRKPKTPNKNNNKAKIRPSTTGKKDNNSLANSFVEGFVSRLHTAMRLDSRKNEYYSRNRYSDRLLDTSSIYSQKFTTKNLSDKVNNNAKSSTSNNTKRNNTTKQQLKTSTMPSKKKPSTATSFQENNNNVSSKMNDLFSSLKLPVNNMNAVRVKEPRNWLEPVSSEGGWIRIFPFDNSKPNKFKGQTLSSTIDMTEIVAKVHRYLQIAYKLVTDYPNSSDEFYNLKIQKAMKLNTEVWLPPLD